MIVNDAFLMGLIANGDPDAVRPLIERYRQPLAALLVRALGRSPDIDDAFQETWIRVVRSAGRYDPTQRFSAWLFAIAWNLMKDRWSRIPPHEAADLTTFPSAQQNPEEAAVARNHAAKVRAMVAQLPERSSSPSLCCGSASSGGWNDATLRKPDTRSNAG